MMVALSFIILLKKNQAQLEMPIEQRNRNKDGDTRPTHGNKTIDRRRSKVKRRELTNRSIRPIYIKHIHNAGRSHNKGFGLVV